MEVFRPTPFGNGFTGSGSYIVFEKEIAKYRIF